MATRKKKAAKKTTKKKTAATKRKDFTIVTESLPFELTEKEINQYASEAAELDYQVKTATVDMKAAAATAKAAIKENQNKLDELLHKVHTKTEDRVVECQRVLNEKSKMTEFWFEGKKIHERPILENDRQTQMVLRKKGEGGAEDYPLSEEEAVEALEDKPAEEPKAAKPKRSNGKVDHKLAAAGDDSFADEFAAL